MLLNGVANHGSTRRYKVLRIDCSVSDLAVYLQGLTYTFNALAKLSFWRYCTLTWAAGHCRALRLRDIGASGQLWACR